MDKNNKNVDKEEKKQKIKKYIAKHEINKVLNEMVNSVIHNKEKSPYFRNMYHKNCVAYVASGLRDQNSLGSDLIFAVI